MVGGVREGQGPGACNASGGHHGRQGRLPKPVTIYDRLAASLDLDMACMTGEGRERSEAEWRAVFALAGFRLVHAAATKSPMYAMLLEPCEKH